LRRRKREPRREEGVRGLHRRNRRTISGELWNLIGGGIELRKVMLLAAVMAMILAAAAPVFAQANAVGGSVQYVDCDQIQAAATGQYNVENDQEALAALAQELGVDQNQVLACFESIAAGGDVNINTAEATVIADTATPKAGGGGGGGSASAAAGGELPSTGGASLLALGAGALLVAGGLLVRRIFR
jgi:LPXTG-motif cell wall-anchored protein